jgi:hypothetical protein
MKIRRSAFAITLCLLLLFFQASALLAEVHRIDISEQTPKATGTQAHKLFMWKATGDDGKSVVYLVGSIHLVKPDFYPLPSDVEKALRDSQVLVLEIDETKQDQAKLNEMTMTRGMYPQGDRVENHISKQTSEQLTAYATSMGRSQTSLSRMKPWLLSLTIPLLELQKRGFAPQIGIDKHFLTEAQSYGKAVDELESGQFQFELLSGFSDELADKLLLSALVDAQNTDRDVNAMIHAWKTGDDKEMEDVVTRDEREHPELKPIMEELLYKRNIGMSDKIADYLRSGKRYFVVVGAGHLVGDRGIVKLLRDKGFKVQQVQGT